MEFFLLFLVFFSIFAAILVFAPIISKLAKRERLPKKAVKAGNDTLSNNKTKLCPYCGEALLAVVIKCKHCGSDLSTLAPPTDKPTVSAIETPGRARQSPVTALVAIVLGGLAWAYVSGWGPSLLNKVSVSIKDPDIVIDAARLWKDYNENEIRADLKYKGKVALVTGTVSARSRDLLDKLYVALRTDSLVFSVQCYFDERYAQRIARLRVGESISVKGVVNGKMGNVLVKECVISE